MLSNLEETFRYHDYIFIAFVAQRLEHQFQFISSNPKENVTNKMKNFNYLGIVILLSVNCGMRYLYKMC